MYTAQFLSERIKQQAKSKNVKLKDMLTELNLNINTISQISDKKGLSCFPLAEIADYLDCSVDYLLGRIDEEIKKAPSLPKETQEVINAMDKVNTDTRCRMLDTLKVAFPEAFNDLTWAMNVLREYNYEMYCNVKEGKAELIDKDIINLAKHIKGVE